jgi:hypothetical protein
MRLELLNIPCWNIYDRRVENVHLTNWIECETLFHANGDIVLVDVMDTVLVKNLEGSEPC